MRPLSGVRRLAAVAVGATLLLIAMGGTVRATDSGLACPDWPACYGLWIPPADLNIWLEHSHRLWAGVVALLIAWLTGWLLLRHRDRPRLVALSITAAVLVLVQSGLGAAVVLFQLRASLVTAHLGMSLLVVGCLITITVLAGGPATPGMPHEVSRRIGRGATVLAAAVFGQALLGGQSTGRGAAYVFNRVPIWLSDDPWTGDAQEILHVTHRAAGYLVAIGVVAFAAWVLRERRRIAASDRWSRWLALGAGFLVILQVGLGVANVLTRAGVISAVGHLTVASWLWSVLLGMAVIGTTAARETPGTIDQPGVIRDELTARTDRVVAGSPDPVADDRRDPVDAN